MRNGRLLSATLSGFINCYLWPSIEKDVTVCIWHWRLFIFIGAHPILDHLSKKWFCDLFLIVQY